MDTIEHSVGRETAPALELLPKKLLIEAQKYVYNAVALLMPRITPLGLSEIFANRLEEALRQMNEDDAPNAKILRESIETLRDKMWTSVFSNPEKTENIAAIRRVDASVLAPWFQQNVCPQLKSLYSSWSLGEKVRYVLSKIDTVPTPKSFSPRLPDEAEFLLQIQELLSAMKKHSDEYEVNAINKILTETLLHPVGIDINRELNVCTIASKKIIWAPGGDILYVQTRGGQSGDAQSMAAADPLRDRIDMDLDLWDSMETECTTANTSRYGLSELDYMYVKAQQSFNDWLVQRYPDKVERRRIWENRVLLEEVKHIQDWRSYKNSNADELSDSILIPTGEIATAYWKRIKKRTRDPDGQKLARSVLLEFSAGFTVGAMHEDPAIIFRTWEKVLEMSLADKSNPHAKANQHSVAAKMSVLLLSRELGLLEKISLDPTPGEFRKAFEPEFSLSKICKKTVQLGRILRKKAQQDPKIMRRALKEIAQANLRDPIDGEPFGTVQEDGSVVTQSLFQYC